MLSARGSLEKVKHGLPPLNIELKSRKEYYEALGEYQTNGNLRPTLDLMLKEYRRLKAALKRVTTVSEIVVTRVLARKRPLWD